MFYLVITIIKLLVVLLKYKNNFFFGQIVQIYKQAQQTVFFIISDKEKVYLKTFLVTVQILCADCGIEMKE